LSFQVWAGVDGKADGHDQASQQKKKSRTLKKFRKGIENEAYSAEL